MDNVLRTRRPWNKGILAGHKRPLRVDRFRLEMSGAHRELALFNLAIDSKLRACDLVKFSSWPEAVIGRRNAGRKIRICGYRLPRGRRTLSPARLRD